MDRKRLRDILCACVILLMVPCGSFIIRGMSGPYVSSLHLAQDDTVRVQDSAAVMPEVATGSTDSTVVADFLAGVDSLLVADSLAVQDSLVVPDPVTVSDSAVIPDSVSVSDSLQDSTAADTVAYTKRQLRQMAKDSARKRKDAYLDSLSAIKQASVDSVRHIRDSIKAFRDSVRWSKPRVLETGFVPDSLYYRRILSWNVGPYVNDYRHMDMDTTFNDWYTEYPFYKEDIDAVYLGTSGSATQNVNFFRRREFDQFKAYAPYLTYSHTPETAPFFNVKAPYTELAYWGTLFAYKEKEETNVRFLHTQNITPELNVAVLFQGWKAKGMLNREATTNNSLELTTNYLGRNYIAHAGFIHQNIDREENGGIQDSYMVRDTTVDGKTIAINLQDANNKLSRNTFFIDHSYNIHLESRSHRLRKAMEEDSLLAVAVDSLVAVRMAAYEAAVTAAVEAAKRKAADTLQAVADSTGAGTDSVAVAGSVAVADSVAAVDSVAVTDSLAVADSSFAAGSSVSVADSVAVPDSVSSAGVVPPMSPEDSLAAVRADSLLRVSIMDTLLPPTEDEIYEQLADSLLFGTLGEGPILTVGHIGEVSRFYRYYTDNITDDVGRNFYNGMFYINPTSSADSTRVFSVDNKLFFRLQPWARNAVVSQINGGLGYRWSSIYGFNPDMFLKGNSNIHQHNAYVYAGAGGQFRKYLNWNAQAEYYFLGYNQNDFSLDAGLDVSFYPFKDKSEPITLRGHFNTSLKEPDWYSQHYWSNHYVWNNDFGKTSTTKVEAVLEIPKWKMEASFSYGLVSNYLYNDTSGIIRQHNGLINVMSGYLRKDFKLWWFHFDNKILFQYSSDRDVLPLPMLTFHMRYYIEMEAVKNVLKVQLGADATMNTPYYVPAYNPALGTFQLQTREQVGYNPYIDLFLNLQWKRVNVFVKVINVGQGWPDGGNMFSAYHYIKPYRGFKVGIHWPFYIE